MKSKIKRIVHYVINREDYFEIYYMPCGRTSGKCVSYIGYENLPKTAVAYLDNLSIKNCKTTYNKIYKRYEIVYEA